MQENIKPIQVKMTDRRYVRTEPIYQYDVGHTLDLSVFAAMLPETFQVHFGRSLMGDSITQIGQACSCPVPDMYAQTAAPIYAWLYIPETETGLTKYTIEIPVQRRARITNQEPTPVERSAIDQEIAALNAGVERAETAAEAAEAAQAGAEAAETGASAAQQTAQAAARTATAQADRAKDEADRAEAAVEDVTEVAEQAAADLGGIVREAQTQIAGSVQEAQTAAQAASGSATAAAGSAGAAAGSATAADQSAQAAAQSKAAMDVRADEIEEEFTSLKSDISAKQDKPVTPGTEGQVLSLDANGNPVWATPTDAVTPDGTFEDLTAGNAKQLLSDKSVEDQVPYKFRPTGGDSDREYLDAVVGGTVVWNQLADYDSSRTYKGLTFTVNGNKMTVNGTAEANIIQTQYVCSIKAVRISANKVVYISGFDGKSKIGLKYIGIGYSGSFFSITNATVVKPPYGIFVFSFVINEGTTFNNEIFDLPIICDLTKMFGSTVADYIYNLETATPSAGIALFRNWFPNGYYEYNPGELVSVSGLQSHDTVGFNVWDEEWEVGTINNSDGTPIPDSSRIRSKNFIPVVPSASYFFADPTNGNNIKIYFYSSDKVLLYSPSWTMGLISIPSTVHFVKFIMAASYGTTYKHDICISLSNSGSRNGEYEPYVKHSYPLDPSVELRGIFRLGANGIYADGDIYPPSGQVRRRCKLLDLGTLHWVKPGTYFRAEVPDKNHTSVNGVIELLLTVKYIAIASSVSSGNMTDKTIKGSNGQNNWKNIYITDSDYDNVADFKAAMSGVMLLYETEEETIEQAQPYRNLQICDPDGTEEFVSTSIVPVGHVTRYPENLRKKIEGLPWNFDSIIAMTETGTTASKAYAVGDYFILNSILYKVTAPIASGGTITPGTNCTATTIMAEIKALA